MEYDYSKLKGRIKEIYNTQGRFAEEVGLSERTISLKINNKANFNQDEIIMILNKLNLNITDAQSYFFKLIVQ